MIGWDSVSVWEEERSIERLLGNVREAIAAT
jgi:hypothetical protein